MRFTGTGNGTGTVSPDDFVEGLMGYSYYNDDSKLISIPFCRSTLIFYYNKDAFREVGLDSEKTPEIQELWASNPMYRVAYDQLQYAVDLSSTQSSRAKSELPSRQS